MLRELSIRSLGVIDSSAVEFAAGLTALTGETGAGKTMLTSGIGLLLGERADPTVVRRGADHARAEGRFSGVGQHLAPALDDLGAELEDDELLVARQVSSTGRSRAWVGGAQTTATALAGVTSELVTVHGQSEQLRLGHPDRQRQLLDRACGPEHEAALAAYRALFERRRSLTAELDDLRRSGQQRAREADLLRFGCAEVEAVRPLPGEDTDLAAEASRLHSLGDLRQLAATVNAALSGDLEAPGAVGLVGVARKAAQRLSSLDPRTEPFAERLAELSVQLDDLASEVAGYEADLEGDPGRLEAVVARQADLARLTRKYGSTVDEVLAWAEQASARLLDLDGSDDRIAALEQELVDLDQELRLRAAGLGRARAARAAALQELVADELAALALPHARLEFRLQPLDEPGPHGADAVALMFSAHPGTTPGPLARVASGGELSRVRLALEVTLARDDPGHTFVFDEVDAGIGGAVALEVGRRLARLARHSQVIVVTHLAQVAAFADAQWVVSKSSDGQVSTSGVRRVTGVEREQELARMMAGLESATAARAHARELLVEASR